MGVVVEEAQVEELAAEMSAMINATVASDQVVQGSGDCNATSANGSQANNTNCTQIDPAAAIDEVIEAIASGDSERIRMAVRQGGF